MSRDKEKARANSRRYRITHPERVRAQHRRWREANPEKRREQNKRNRNAHPETKRARTKRWKEANRKKTQIMVRGWMLKSKYGLTLEAFEALLLGQGGVCAACRTSDWGRLGPIVDHDHSSGKVRGILCFGCNSAEGHLDGDPARAQALANYMERNKI